MVSQSQFSPRVTNILANGVDISILFSSLRQTTYFLTKTLQRASKNIMLKNKRGTMAISCINICGSGDPPYVTYMA